MIEVIKNIQGELPTFLITNYEATKINDKENKGGGFGNPEENRRVEKAAVSYVTKKYQENGWVVESVETKKCGFDLRCSNNVTQEHVEVKGIKGDTLSFIITPGEVKLSKNDERFILFAVTEALTDDPKPHIFNGKDFNEKFHLETLSYHAVLKQG